MTVASGSWLPAARAAARIALGSATAPRSAPAWTDGTETVARGELARRVRACARGLPPGPVIIHDAEPLRIAVESLAGLLKGRSVRIVPRSAGTKALSTATASRMGRGVAFFTSGTTGDPTLRHTKRGPLATGQLISTLGVLPLPRHPRVGCLSPIDHGHGWSVMLLTLLSGGHFIAASQDRSLLAGSDGVDLLTGLPLTLRECAEAARRPRVGLVLSGSDRLDDADFLTSRFDAPVYDAYGSTEAGTLCVASPADRLRSPGTVGRPLSFVRVTEVDGLLEFSSPMLGRARFRGDRGRISAGLVHVTGRSDASVVSGGVVTDPRRLRDWLLAVDGVTSVSVAEEPDARFGVRHAATIASGLPIDPAELRARIRVELGAAATPVSIRVERTDPAGRSEP